jgi:hypothetical protein
MIQDSNCHMLVLLQLYCHSCLSNRRPDFRPPTLPRRDEKNTPYHICTYQTYVCISPRTRLSAPISGLAGIPPAKRAQRVAWRNKKQEAESGKGAMVTGSAASAAEQQPLHRTATTEWHATANGPPRTGNRTGNQHNSCISCQLRTGPHHAAHANRTVTVLLPFPQSTYVDCSSRSIIPHQNQLTSCFCTQGSLSLCTPTELKLLREKRSTKRTTSCNAAKCHMTQYGCG